MGNREALVDGAKECLLAKGYSRTTARDIATAAGVSLAAIGYHFGSKDVLLNEALRELLIHEWAAEVGGAAGPNEAAGGPRDADAAVAYAAADPGSATAGGVVARERFVAAWGQVAGSLENPRLRALWAAQFEVLSLGATMPELVSDLSMMQFEAREGLAQLFGGVGPAADPEQVEEIGTLLQAILLGVVALNMFDPGSAPTGDQLARSLRTLADRVSPSA
ncbi:helix-turn-helix domain containing protein [Kribbella solani]|uniref:TetR/AcrR family transcriptional regulator n=1 Tax=Kribbella solani TaxID=236067 RepID=UPI00299FFF41|nr:helix-turn-helix domain-containing protein [Kribbella solani]MDX2972390.1 helix-turn-helix domain containing protein [Kribbella solani]MDX3004026.1 helix-turn-helix domain containing protein [Kribbella solani]